jgi:hypothetical protein
VALPAIVAALAPIIGGLLEKVIPDTAARDKVAGEIAQKTAEAANAALLSQLEINKTEAEHPSVFVSGWRPAVGWTCVAGFAYTYVLWAFLAWASAIANVPAPPQLDMGDLLFLLGSLLGVSVSRTVEKLKGVAHK